MSLPGLRSNISGWVGVMNNVLLVSIFFSFLLVEFSKLAELMFVELSSP